MVRRLVREWAEIAQRGMPSAAIIEALDVKENVGLCLLTRLVMGMMHPLHFQCAKEAFHHRVVVAVARAAHADLYVVCGEQLLIRLAGVLTPAVGVKEQLGLRAGLPPGHTKRIADERHGHSPVHRPANDTPRKQVDDHRQVQPAGGGPDVGDVPAPLLRRPRRCKSLLQMIRCRLTAVLLFRRHLVAPRLFGADAMLPHQPGDPVNAASDLILHLCVDARAAVRTVAGRKRLLNRGQQRLVGHLPLTDGPRPPGVIPAA